MPEIIIYTKSTCPYCIAAKELLTKKTRLFMKFRWMATARRRPLWL